MRISFGRVVHEHHREKVIAVPQLSRCGEFIQIKLEAIRRCQPTPVCRQTVKNDAEPLQEFGFSAPWRKSSTNDERRPKPPCRFCDSDAVTQQVSRLLITYLHGWLGSRVVSGLDSGAERPGFKPQPRRCRVTVLGKLFTPVVPLFNSSEIFSSPFKVCEGNCGPGGK